jgi:flagellar hook-associated protein 1 FlgK
MSNLLAALANGGNALRQFEKAVSLTQTDVVNASTPGYAAQQLRFEATPPESGLYGGVQVAAIESTRDDFAESAVRRQTTQQGFFTQTAQTLASVESAFDVGTEGGLAGSLQSLFNSFSAWSQQPNDANSRQSVISAADKLAVSFRQAAGQIQDTAAGAIRQAQTLGAKVNEIGKQLAEINRILRQNGGSASASVDAEVYSKLEELSQITSFTVARASDGTLTVLLSGQVPLVVGDHNYQIQVTARNVATAGSPPAIQITDASHQDVTAIMTTGQLGGLIRCVNHDVGGLLGDDTQAGSLNNLALTLASRVNALLQQGTLADGTTPGVPLFDVAGDGSAAATLRLANITPDQLAASDPGPPPAVSGIALKLAGLSAPSSAADKVNGSSYLDYYGQIASEVGSAVGDAKTNQTRYTQLASQARSLRSEVSGVSLDEEAVRLVEFQRAYEATARVVTTLNQMMDTLMQMG